MLFLRAFEQEMGVEVVRPNIAGLMGAYGAALYAKKKSKGVGKSTITDKRDLMNLFTKSRLQTAVCATTTAVLQ